MKNMAAKITPKATLLANYGIATDPRVQGPKAAQAKLDVEARLFILLTKSDPLIQSAAGKILRSPALSLPQKLTSLGSMEKLQPNKFAEDIRELIQLNAARLAEKSQDRSAQRGELEHQAAQVQHRVRADSLTDKNGKAVSVVEQNALPGSSRPEPAAAAPTTEPPAAPSWSIWDLYASLPSLEDLRKKIVG